MAASDFETLRAEIDPFLELTDALRGRLIEAEVFPGWDGFAGLKAHRRFLRDHHRQIERVAVVSDSSLLSFLPRLARYFVAAEVRHFHKGDRADAFDWVRSA